MLYPCLNCPFKGSKVGSKGDPDSPFVIIGESPGKKELKDGIPFVGPSGKVLDVAIAQGGSCVKPYYINAIQCYPGSRDEKDQSQVMAAVAICRDRVLKDISRVPRKVILSLGVPALWSITGNFDLKVTAERGKILQTPLASVGLVPSVHPSFLMSGGTGATFQQYMRDTRYALDLLQGRPPKKPPTIEAVVAKSYRDLQSWARLFRYFSVIGADIETSGFSHFGDRVLSIGFAGAPGYVYVVPERLIKYTGILFDNTAEFVWHNGKFDVKFLWKAGVKNARVDHDIMLLSYALDETGGIHDLEQVASDWLNSPNWKSMLNTYLPDRKSSYAVIPEHILHKYMALDVGNTRALFNILYPLVCSDPHLNRLYHRTLLPANLTLAHTEYNGIHVDLARVKENDDSYQVEIDKFRGQIIEIGNRFPESHYTEKLPGSHLQLKRLLYDDLRLPMYKRKRTTSKKFLDRLPPHPVVKLLRQYRKVAKEKGTYVTPLLGKPNKQGVREGSIIERNGRVHATFKIHGTRTGRLASSDPNMQNIPRNPVIRGQFVASPGYRLVEVDLNQAELRILAHLSGDPELCKIYLTSGMSLHDEVRAEIWGDPKSYTTLELQKQLNKFSLTENTRFDENGKDLLVAEQKMRAKNVNFGVVYGITAAGLAEQSDTTQTDAQEWIDKWFGKFKLAGVFINQCKMAPINGKTLITPFGRKRRPGCVSQEMAPDLMNQFANYPEQSSASDCTLHAGIELEEEMRDSFNTILINLIHDALLWEVPDDDAIARGVAIRVKEVMEKVPRKWGFNRIPFIAEAKQGYRWGSLKEMEL